MAPSSVLGGSVRRSQSVELVHQGGATVDVAAVDLEQHRARVEHRPAVVGTEDAADADDRQAGPLGEEGDDGTRPARQRGAREPARLTPSPVGGREALTGHGGGPGGYGGPTCGR